MEKNETHTTDQDNSESSKPNILRAVIGFTIYILLSPVLLFTSAGTLDWPMAWLYIALLLVSIIGSRLISLWLHPDLLRERAKIGSGEGAAAWDKLLVPIMALLAPAIIVIVAGLDHRYGWPPDFAPVVQYMAAFMIFIGYGASVWAMSVNRFFSAVVRIQKDRGHVVVSTGPYRIVRHPSYAGGLLAGLALPFMLNTLWALVPTLAFLAPLIIRTAHEDRLLINELEGYAEYAKKTRHRLIPGIW